MIVFEFVGRGLYWCAAQLTNVCLAFLSQIVPQEKYWEVVVVTGKADNSQAAPGSHTDLSTLYTLDAITGDIDYWYSYVITHTCIYTNIMFSHIYIQ